MEVEGVRKRRPPAENKRTTSNPQLIIGLFIKPRYEEDRQGEVVREDSLYNLYRNLEVTHCLTISQRTKTKE